MGLNLSALWLPGLVQEINRTLEEIAANPWPIILILNLVVAIRLAAWALPEEKADRDATGSLSLREKIRGAFISGATLARSSHASESLRHRGGDAGRGTSERA